MPRDRRRLGPEEEALWSAVKSTVEPLRRTPRRRSEREPERPAQPPVPDAVPPAPADIAAVTPKPVPPPRPAIPGLHTLGRRERQKLARGRSDIDARIDLHGLTQHEAHARLSGFLSWSQMQGFRVVLVITGKGRPGGFESLHGAERGVLRRVVPMWLSLPEFRRLVLGFEEAHLAHGGSGALYVRIRRRKA